jgi:hypothetical protein
MSLTNPYLFDQSVVSYISDNQRVAIGRPGEQTYNQTFAAHKNQLNNQLSFLKPASNLSELTNKAVARTNLDVFSKSEISGSYALKSYVDSQDNAVAAFVNQQVGILAGRFYRFVINVPQSDWADIGTATTALKTLNFPSPIPTPYTVSIMKKFDSQGVIHWHVGAETVNSVNIRLLYYGGALPVTDMYGFAQPDSSMDFDVTIISFGT